MSAKSNPLDTPATRRCKVDHTTRPLLRDLFPLARAAVWRDRIQLNKKRGKTEVLPLSSVKCCEAYLAISRLSSFRFSPSTLPFTVT